MKNPYLLRQQWDRYLVTAFPGLDLADVSLPQIQDMRRCFYAGAHVLLSALVLITDDGEPEPTALNLQLLDGIHDEIQEHARDVREGRA